MNELGSNLIDMTESLADKLDCASSRIDDNGVSVILHGRRSDYHLTVILKPDYDMLYFSCDLNIKVPKSMYNLVADAVIKANERIWLGHFDILSDDREIVFTVTIPFVSSFVADELVIEAAVGLVMNECDHFYNYFLMLAKGDSSYDNFSIDTMFMDPLGEA